MPAAPTFFDIPAGTREAACRSCDEPIYWIETVRGKRMPVDLTANGASAPDRGQAGSGTSHFIGCPGANAHRTPR